MTMQWFRLYSRIVDDDKLRLLAFEDRWHFVALCCLKSDGLLDEDEGDLRTRRIAVKLGVQLRELDEIGRRLTEVGLVDETLCPLAWDDLQFRSDNSTDRVREFRKRQQNQRWNGAKQPRNVSEAAQETEADTDSEGLSSKDDCPADAERALDIEEVFQGYRKLASDLALSVPRDLIPSRRQLIGFRIKQYPLSDFQAVFGKCRGSAFLRGDKGRTPVTLDWLFKRANFQKVLEGNYD